MFQPRMFHSEYSDPVLLSGYNQIQPKYSDLVFMSEYNSVLIQSSLGCSRLFCLHEQLYPVRLILGFQIKRIKWLKFVGNH